MIHYFLKSIKVKNDLLSRFRELPSKIDGICHKALKVKAMNDLRRNFLTRIAKREHLILLDHFKFKKKNNEKKTYS